MMVSWYFLLIAFLGGVFFGIILIALCAVNSDKEGRWKDDE